MTNPTAGTKPTTWAAVALAGLLLAACGGSAAPAAAGVPASSPPAPAVAAQPTTVQATPAAASQPTALPATPATAPQPTTAPTAALALTAPAKPTATASGAASQPSTGMAAQAVGGGDKATIARGENIYQHTAGGLGCKMCHGPAARGDIGPNIVGKSKEDIVMALGSVTQMAFIQQTTPLSDADISAVAAYLKSLDTGKMP